MAIYNPHLLSHKLCRVLDAGHATVEDIAKVSGESVSLIEKVARGPELRLDIATKHRIGKALSPYFRAHPELYRDMRPASKRGVFEDPQRFKGARVFTVVDSTGECLMRTEIKPDFATPAFEARLWRWLDTVDPVPTLQVI